MNYKSGMTKVGLFYLVMGAGIAHAQEVRQLDSHEHGVSSLKVAVEGDVAVFELKSPGADIVGFEHEPENDQQKKLVSDALASLKTPMSIFIPPSDAGCELAKVEAEFESDHEEEHDDHDDDHKKEAKHDDHDDDHKEGEKHDDHAEEHKDEKKHDHADGHEGEEEGHAEFHVSWELKCSNASALTELETTFFKQFSNAEELELEAFTDLGQTAKEIEKGATKISLKP